MKKRMWILAQMVHLGVFSSDTGLRNTDSCHVVAPSSCKLIEFMVFSHPIKKEKKRAHMGRVWG